ncbi:angiopoietin-related protein 1-like [Anopheles darlingi]|uniref:angiopoietin-related protein 1-like n=1 Tax=Anopheles darlingi TaxID=43151 RepID=UPI0021000855|nr:angiopoietin-related protein 1-like [Anopheles darlingi]
MNLAAKIALFCMAMATVSSDQSKVNSITAESSGYELSGFSLELLLSQLDNIQHTLLEQHRSTHKEIFAAFHKFEHEFERNLTVLQNISFMIPTEPSSYDTPKPQQPSYSSCKTAPSNVSGVYRIRVKSDSEPIEVYCEQETYGGGWVVVQQRMDGYYDFYQNWTEYRDGFGDLEEEFWLGLEKMHRITAARPHELLVEMMDFTGYFTYAHYTAFKIGSESEQYRLKSLGTYSGTAGDSLSYNKRMKFTTKDRDNDLLGDTQCAHITAGAWWHNGCTYANLNGRHLNANNKTSMYWYSFKFNHQGMRFSRMMIRPLKKASERERI